MAANCARIGAAAARERVLTRTSRVGLGLGILLLDHGLRRVQQPAELSQHRRFILDFAGHEVHSRDLTNRRQRVARIVLDVPSWRAERVHMDQVIGGQLLEKQRR